MTTAAKHRIDRIFRICLSLLAVVLAGVFGYIAFLLAFAAEGNRLWINCAWVICLASALGLLVLAVTLVLQKPTSPTQQ